MGLPTEVESAGAEGTLVPPTDADPARLAPSLLAVDPPAAPAGQVPPPSGVESEGGDEGAAGGATAYEDVGMVVEEEEEVGAGEEDVDEEAGLGEASSLKASGSGDPLGVRSEPPPPLPASEQTVRVVPNPSRLEQVESQHQKSSLSFSCCC